MSNNKRLVNGVQSSGGGGSSGGGKLSVFEILFDTKTPGPCYKSGEEITGQIRIVLKEPMKMKMVKLQFVGRTRVGWSEQVLTLNNDASSVKKATDNSAANGPKSKYSHEIVHIDKTIDLLERRPGQELPHDFLLPAGENILPFSFPLPRKSLPTSFESDCAYVRYFCRAAICKPWKHDHVTKRAFCVLASADWKLAAKDNMSADLFKPLAMAETAMSKSCFCMKGRLTCEASLPKQVYNVGESLIVGCKVINGGKGSVSQVAFRLVQTVTCKGQSKDKQGERTTVFNRVAVEKLAFEKQIHDGHSKKAELHDDEIVLKIPSCAPTCVDNSVLRVEYQLRADVRVGANEKSKEALSVRLPITVVGTPFDGKGSVVYEKDCFGERSIRDDEDNQFTYGNLEFAPYYTKLNL